MVDKNLQLRVRAGVEDRAFAEPLPQLDQCIRQDLPRRRTNTDRRTKRDRCPSRGGQRLSTQMIGAPTGPNE